jgi:hypothetical protein
MGRHSDLMISDQERGFRSIDDTGICEDCINEPGLRAFVISNYSVYECSFCKKASTIPVACTFDDFVTRILEGINLEYGDPASEGLPYESREGGWQGNTIDIYELLSELDVGDSADGLFDLVAQSIDQDLWCERDPYSLRPHQTMSYGWEAFCQFIINRSRYLFFLATNADYDPHQHDEMNPVDILDKLGEVVKQLNLIEKLAIDTPIHRVRIVKPEVMLTNAAELGAPPNDFCVLSNRMSPAGISMFYGAFDVQTAIDETFSQQDDKRHAISGQFYPTRELLVLNLAGFIELPSIFEVEKSEARRVAPFLIRFIEDFTKPIERNQRANIDYVPTQVVTEYFRHIFEVNGEKLDAIKYPSSKNGKEAIVVFADSRNCADEGHENRNTLLKLTQTSTHKL